MAGADCTFRFLAARTPGGFFSPGTPGPTGTPMPDCLPTSARCRRRLLLLAAAGLLAGCAGQGPRPPYPAFVDSTALPDAFLAGLPGVRAKVLAGDAETGRSSSVVTLPPDWQFGTGASPDRSVEIYVLAGSLRLADITLGPGGYAYLPDGSMGLSMQSDTGARLLYFLDSPNPGAVIRTPLVLDQAEQQWQPAPGAFADPSIWFKELRVDPGSGSRTVLVRIEPGATIPWQRSDVPEEGYLLEGVWTHAECVAGEPAIGTYTPGGYYRRPADVVNGGPGAGADVASTWLVRTPSEPTVTPAGGCPADTSP